MDDLDPELKSDDMEDEGVEDEFLLNPKKPKKAGDDDVPLDDDTVSLDEEADAEDEVLPEDRFDDMEPEDLW